MLDQDQGHSHVRKKAGDGEPTEEGNGRRTTTSSNESRACAMWAIVAQLLLLPDQDEPSGCSLYVMGIVCRVDQP